MGSPSFGLYFRRGGLSRWRNAGALEKARSGQRQTARTEWGAAGHGPPQFPVFILMAISCFVKPERGRAKALRQGTGSRQGRRIKKQPEGTPSGCPAPRQGNSYLVFQRITSAPPWRRLPPAWPSWPRPPPWRHPPSEWQEHPRQWPWPQPGPGR